MRILVAEDNAASRLILEAALKSLGHDCVLARDGDEAWRLFQAGGADAVISDRMMPGMDGVELCRRIRQHDGAAYTYFIFLTAFDKKAEVISRSYWPASTARIPPPAVSTRETISACTASERTSRSK